MHNTIISDTSILIVFQKIDHLSLLNRVYGDIFITPEIAKEYGEALPPWIKIKKPTDIKYQYLLETQIDTGEASAIALATDFDDVLLLLDDLKARKLAIKLNYKVTGTLGIIHKAKQMLIIEAVKPLIDKLIKTNFRISDDIVKEILTINKEI
jgi:predicted nucleic acid-binding protein